MNRVMQLLVKVFPGMGITLLVFDMNAPGRVNYISNAERDSMLTAMKEFIPRNEGRMMEPPETNQ